VVEVCTRSTLQEIVELSDDLRRRIQQSGQVILDDLESGIELTDVDLPETQPPFAIVKAYGDLRNAREDALRQVAAAQSDAQTTLDKTTANHEELARLIDAYERAVDLEGDEQAARQLAVVNAALEGPGTTGDVARVIGRAKAFESELDSTLGHEVSRFFSVLPAYRANPELEIQRRCLQAYSNVMRREDVEVFYVPRELENLSINVTGLEAVQKLRSELQLDRKKQQATMEAISELERNLRYETADTVDPGAPKPRLEIKDGRVVPRGSGG
jgi:regulator of protease activity HflC (stomatin/prohibitin superfamily)